MTRRNIGIIRQRRNPVARGFIPSARRPGISMRRDAAPSEEQASGRPLELKSMLCCPRCRSALELDHDPVVCRNARCLYARDGFPHTAGQPVLVDFERSIFDRGSYDSSRGSVMRRDDTGKGMALRLRRLVTGTNPVTPEKSREMVARLTAQHPAPTLLVIGGGAIGAGTDQLYAAPNVRVVGTDVYASPNTQVVADGHFLPFRDGVFDGVWIQAVLEHVLDPAALVAEIHRVLKPAGLVYADTPFMQQVHEQAYDFTRFTLSGHRWLFRRFEEIDAGAVGGAGKVLLWSIRHVALSLGFGTRMATLTALPFGWLRLVDRFAKPGPKADAASGVYFFGRRSERALRAKDMPGYYEAKR
jgi:SAM-dependent methyltransferase